MTPAQREHSQRERRIYMNSFAPIITPTRTEIFESLVRLAHANRLSGRGVRVGAILTGEATLGKSTLLQWIGREYEIDVRQMMKSIYGDEWMMPDREWAFTPVVYIALTGTPTTKGIYRSLARFLQIPHYDTLTEAQLRDRVLRALRNMGTSLILIDDIHYLTTRFKGAISINNELKYLMSETSATFMYAGIDCKSSGLFEDFTVGGNSLIHKPRAQAKTTGAAAQGNREEPLRMAFSQTNHRFISHELLPFNEGCSNLPEGEQLVQDMLSRLVLVRQPNQLPAAYTTYILKRTNGYVGAIRNLIRLAAEQAIEDKSERLTGKLLKSIKLDNASERW